jgi:ABC-type transporter Mla maintaining outer membrane lipid asymmetry ATPase subunit MlaF
VSAAIEIHGLRVERGGREVLHEVALDVELGLVTGLLGPSGSGKSTLIRSTGRRSSSRSACRCSASSRSSRCFS